MDGIFTAYLIPEPKNSYDRNAVMVCHAGCGVVGYLPRELAAIVGPALLRWPRNRLACCSARLVGGGKGRSFGVYLNANLKAIEAGPETNAAAVKPSPRVERPATGTPGFRTGFSDAAATDDSDDSYDLSWSEGLSGDPVRDVARLREQLRSDPDPIDRHYMYTELERGLYRARDGFASALQEYDDVCRAHDAEMDTIRAALLTKFGRLPLLETYKQAAIRHQKAGNWEDAAWWAQRGLEIYAEDAADPLWVEDLAKRQVRFIAQTLEKGGRAD